MKTQLHIKAFPKSGRSEVEGWRNGILIVRLKSAPDKGKANKELIKLLKKHYSAVDVKIISGTKSRNKIVEIYRERKKQQGRKK